MPQAVSRWFGTVPQHIQQPQQQGAIGTLVINNQDQPDICASGCRRRRRSLRHQEAQESLQLCPEERRQRHMISLKVAGKDCDALVDPI
jgi:hypothetical protein